MYLIDTLLSLGILIYPMSDNAMLGLTCYQFPSVWLTQNFYEDAWWIHKNNTIVHSFGWEDS